MRKLRIIANIYIYIYICVCVCVCVCVAQSSRKSNAVFHFKNPHPFWSIFCVCACSVQSSVEYRFSVCCFLRPVRYEVSITFEIRTVVFWVGTFCRMDWYMVTNVLRRVTLSVLRLVIVFLRFAQSSGKSKHSMLHWVKSSVQSNHP